MPLIEITDAMRAIKDAEDLLVRRSRFYAAVSLIAIAVASLLLLLDAPDRLARVVYTVAVTFFVCCCCFRNAAGDMRRKYYQAALVAPTVTQTDPEEAQDD